MVLEFFNHYFECLITVIFLECTKAVEQWTFLSALQGVTWLQMILGCVAPRASWDEFFFHIFQEVTKKNFLTGNINKKRNFLKELNFSSNDKEVPADIGKCMEFLFGSCLVFPWKIGLRSSSSSVLLLRFFFQRHIIFVKITIMDFVLRGVGTFEKWKSWEINQFSLSPTSKLL